MNATTSFSLLELFRLGGIFMWPLLLFSIATIAISLERAIYIFYHNLRMDNLKARVEIYIKAGDIPGARRYLSALSKRRMGARILLTLVSRADAGAGRQLSEQRLERAVEAEALGCINSLENGFNFLTALGSLSPLTGFLGTVSGMIGAFRSIAEATEVNAQIVANGIYEALITTVFGLIIAIIAMIAHSLFSHIVDRFAADVEKACSELITELAVSAGLQLALPDKRSRTSFAGEEMAGDSLRGSAPL
ncbi:MAG: MotA/TolQ/ExbB proton channel family protein [Treponema sp.]|jgi:biopolymer transport protein ExbB|nr:MotA/TolQ/ExbB proton channel family protein [Treponema sp.]